MISYPVKNLKKLSPRQRQMAALVRAGLSNDQIAQEMKLKVTTVIDALHKIYERVGLVCRRYPRMHLAIMVAQDEAMEVLSLDI